MPHLGILKVLGDETSRPGEPVGKRLADLRGRRESEIVVPAEMLTIGEMTRWISQATGPPNPMNPFRWDMSQQIDFRHLGRANFVFGDNHVEADAPAQLAGPAETVRRRWNYDHLPHDENWR
jgi:prepilin-type processing-associated H-X9-DG protein